MKKKVLFVLPYWIRGGAEKQFRYIYEAISEYHDVDILLFNNTESDIPNLKNKYYIENRLFEEKNKFVKLILRLNSYARIKSFIKKELPNYDVAIGHNKLLVPIMPMLKKKCNRVIFSAREADKDFCKGIIRKIISELDMITCNSKSTYELLKNINSNIVCINNGVEVENNMNFNNIVDIKTIGIIANISRRKNVKLVIEALQYISTNIKVIIAGKIVDNDYYQEIKKYINDNNLENRVKFLNYINDMNEFYNNCDIVVLPSLYEGTSNVILESFSRKKLILLSDIPENRCLINDKYRNMIMFNPYKFKDLANKINNISELILDDKIIIEQIIEDNYKFVNMEYSIDNLKSKYLELL